MARLVVDREILEAALIGLRVRETEIDARIADLRKQVTGSPGGEAAAPAGEPKRVRGPVRAAAKRRISLAQKRRWAAYRAAKAAAQAEAEKKAAARPAAKRSRPAAVSQKPKPKLGTKTQVAKPKAKPARAVKTATAAAAANPASPAESPSE
ncbi:MAG TPA: hypothetical protein VFA33_20115 [Bryobacteraceae bacterium]|nr:hypothetical protein [Bryobacteraceae bacterium]